MLNNQLNRSQGHNPNARNSSGDDFWYSDAKMAEARSKLDPMPNQHSQALRDPVAQNQYSSNNQSGGYYQNQPQQNQGQRMQNKMYNEYGNQGYENNNNGSQNKRQRDMNYNYYE